MSEWFQIGSEEIFFQSWNNDRSIPPQKPIDPSRLTRRS